MENEPQMPVQIHIRIEPVVEEATDMDTLALVNDVHEGVLASLPHQAPYTIELLSEHKRDAGLIVVGLMAVGNYLATNKDQVTALLQLLQTGINALSQQKNVRNITASRDGRSISIDGHSLESEAKLVDWITREPETLPQPGSTVITELTATVSQDEEE